MAIVTEHRFTYCTNCDKQTSNYVLELGYTGPICISCLIGPNRIFPLGKSIYQPCSLCHTPEIHCFCEDDYDCCGPQIRTNCGSHYDDITDLGSFFQ